jgi:hypothetical protein
MAGWLGGMNQYNDAGRAFWIEAYGGRPFRVERQKHPLAIDVPRLAVSAYGGIQPEKLAGLLKDADDGLFARIVWAWPAPTTFRLGLAAPRTGWAIDALERLRQLELTASSSTDDGPKSVYIPLAEEVLPALEALGQRMQLQQAIAGGLMRSGYGKARGLALRISLVLELLWWCGSGNISAVPTFISNAPSPPRPGS